MATSPSQAAVKGAPTSSNTDSRQKQNHGADEVTKALRQIASAQAKQSERGEYEKPCADGEYNNRSDLCAQWYAARAARDAADWAYWAVFWGVASLVLSVLGLVALLRSLLQTERALREARRGNRISLLDGRRARREYSEAKELAAATLAETKRAGDAAERSVIEARRIGEAQVRCYLTGIRAQIGFAKGGATLINCFVKNTGQTPARNVRCTAELAFQSGSEYQFLSDRFPGTTPFEVEIAAGAEERIAYTVKASYEDWSPPPEEVFHISVRVDITAVDVFGQSIPTVVERFSAVFSTKPSKANWIEAERSGHVVFEEKSPSQQLAATK
ncbi:hypothetical protein [Sphingomonas astaxanthinifaciens]|nr:hypothetical protein [Sphingomonas astaxanthinifaciens]